MKYQLVSYIVVTMLLAGRLTSHVAAAAHSGATAVATASQGHRSWPVRLGCRIPLASTVELVLRPALVVLVFSASLHTAGPVGAEVKASQGAHPTVAELLKVSTARMLDLGSVHSQGAVSLWSSGTNGNHIPVSTHVFSASDCSIATRGQQVEVRTKFHVSGFHLTSGRRDQSVNVGYTTISSGRKSATGGSSVRFWERSARTHWVWRRVSVEKTVQEPAYFLGSTGICPNDRTIQLLTPSHFTFVGISDINGRPSWHVHGQKTFGDTTDLQLYIDRATLRWTRIATTFLIRNNGRLVNRLTSAIDYSRFDNFVTISPPAVVRVSAQETIAQQYNRVPPIAARVPSVNTEGDILARRAVASMKLVRTIQSRGSFGGSPVLSTFTGMCVLSEPRARMSFHSGIRLWQIILVSKPKQRDWIRNRFPGASWGKWEAQATGPGDFNFPLLLPLACPHLALHDWRLNNTALHFQLSGAALVGGRQTWRLHVSVGGPPSHTTRTTLEWYVDKITDRLLRWRFTQFNTAGKPGFVEDVSYFGVDSIVTIFPPPQ